MITKTSKDEQEFDRRLTNIAARIGKRRAASIRNRITPSSLKEMSIKIGKRKTVKLLRKELHSITRIECATGEDLSQQRQIIEDFVDRNNQ